MSCDWLALWLLYCFLFKQVKKNGTRDKKAFETKPNFDGTRFKSGDVVRVKDNDHTAKQLQGNHCTGGMSPARDVSIT